MQRSAPFETDDDADCDEYDDGNGYGCDDDNNDDDSETLRALVSVNYHQYICYLI